MTQSADIPVLQVYLFVFFCFFAELSSFDDLPELESAFEMTGGKSNDSLVRAAIPDNFFKILRLNFVTGWKSTEGLGPDMLRRP